MLAVGGSEWVGDSTEDGSGLDMLEELLICDVFQLENLQVELSPQQTWW